MVNKDKITTTNK